VVTPGDNLWDLSAAALARATARERVTLVDDEIARYWRTVCDVNRDTLRSGNVNVIYPGEIVALPPVT
jgi:nucleoid-associated protein YgaU